MSDQKLYKQILGEYVVKHFVKDNMVVGLGTGSTAIWAVREIARKISSNELKNVRCGVTGPGTELEAAKFNVPVYNLNSPVLKRFDITIDGADEYDSQHNMIKGGGGCLLHEKLIAYNSSQFVCVVGPNKLTNNFGKTFAIPVEVIPSAVEYVKSSLQKIMSVEKISLRLDGHRVGPWITEEANYILDILLKEPIVSTSCARVEKEIVQVVGVVESGIFSVEHLGLKPIVCVYTGDTSKLAVHRDMDIGDQIKVIY